MKYLSFLIIMALFLSIGCGPTNTTKGDMVGCIEDKHCKDDKVCVSGSCIKETACTENKDCLNGEYCNENKLCEPFCKEDKDCGAGFICNQESKKCERDNTKLCEEDKDCKTGEVCKDYVCVDDSIVQSCDTDSECKNGEHCRDKKCVENCNADNCPENQICDTDTKDCKDIVCKSDSDCSDGDFCEDQKCVTKEFTCKKDLDCYRGYHCEDKLCQLDCTENSCPDGKVCNVVSGECVSKEPICGDGLCSDNENLENCYDDCRDNHCDDGSEIKCKMMRPECRRGEIVAYVNNCYQCVNIETCEPMVGPTCGNNICERGENFENCPQDCGGVVECNQAIDCRFEVWPINCMGHWECAENRCVPTCSESCGDGRCDVRGGETKENCSADCRQNTECRRPIDCLDKEWGMLCEGHWKCSENACVPECGGSCGNGRCEKRLGENKNNCAIDCNEDLYCGDGVCSDGERYTCPEDCNEGPVCGNNICEMGEWDSCPRDCQSQGCVSNRECRDPEKPICDTTGVCIRDNHCDDGTEPMCDSIPPRCEDGKILAYKNFCYQCVDPNTCTSTECGNEICEPGEEDRCPRDCQGPVCGNRICEAGEYDSCPRDCVTQPCRSNRDCEEPTPICGDNGICQEREGPTCGNGVCEMGEWDSCPSDCQEPQECRESRDCVDKVWSVRCVGHWSCGNGQCDETCDMESCGDGRCDRRGGETATSCPSDCSEEPPFCGDGVCNGRENPITCPSDCSEEPICRTNRDCRDPRKPLCDNGVCVADMEPECQIDQDCGDPRLICSDGGICKPRASECGNLICELGERRTCPEDCENIECGNLICEPGERRTCPEDCENNTECGNLICEQGERDTCPEDCMEGCRTRRDCPNPQEQICQEGICQDIETLICNIDEDCGSRELICENNSCVRGQFCFDGLISCPDDKVCVDYICR